jgi:UDP-N-acetylmuramate--alanine ligase
MKIHFIGIGGIGVSALARYYLSKGHEVSGSDLFSSEITDALKKKGLRIRIGKPVEAHPQQADLLVYSPAVGKNNPELKTARKAGVKCLSYPESLGELTKKHFTIAVSGTHGKSTTASMLGLLLVKAGLDPTVIVGTKLKEFGNSNCRPGDSRYLVIEADEHFASFLNYWPEIIVLTSIEADHLDYYKNLKNILKTFRKYLKRLPKKGAVVANKDDKNTCRILAGRKTAPLRKYWYGSKQKETVQLKKILKIPGEHNIGNALAALTAARVLGIPDRISFQSLAAYRGSWRRFEEKKLKIKNRKLTIISDYGHHPTEVKATLKAAREKYPKKKIWCVYQPHQYQRTYYLFKDFVKVFKQMPLDKTIITDIYDVAGREEKNIKKKVNAEKLAAAVKNEKTVYLPTGQILNYLEKNLSSFDVLIIMGAGDIYRLADSLTGLTKKRNKKKI